MLVILLKILQEVCGTGPLFTEAIVTLLKSVVSIQMATNFFPSLHTYLICMGHV